MDSKKRWLSTKEVAEEYGIAINTQAQYRMRGIIPYSKINRIIRYDRYKLDEWFEKHSIDCEK
ncbi:MAG: helix-turn-helix domain-containing protein [Campylobacteraceae bacterium]|nr:helix-turn-helix domain-containing protein [Campylobacteraceae bacterium]